MLRKLILAAAAAVVLPLSAATGAASAAPAVPAHSSNCDVSTTFCNFLANYAADWWAYGTIGNEGIISDASSSQWWYRSRETGWGVLEDKNGNCLQYIPDTGTVDPSSCSAGTSNTKELWNFGSGPSGSDVISNYYDGVGQYFWIDNSSGVYVELVGGGAEAGSELYMRA